jgi:hypothetical protein
VLIHARAAIENRSDSSAYPSIFRTLSPLRSSACLCVSRLYTCFSHSSTHGIVSTGGWYFIALGGCPYAAKYSTSRGILRAEKSPVYTENLNFWPLIWADFFCSPRRLGRAIDLFLLVIKYL